MSTVTLVHLSDIHFGGSVDLVQVEVLEELVPTLGAHAIVVSGDLTQRARHGEFQRALVLVQRLRAHAPTLVIPGNHDIEWWKSPLGICGERIKYAKYVSYFGDLRPVLEIPGAIIAGALSSYGVALGSLTWNVRDVAVKGHLPRSETKRVTGVFARAPAGVARILAIHHNIMPGALSHRMGLARWRSAQRRVAGTGADVILCGHDHQEGAGQVDGGITVSTAGTHSFRSRRGRASVFNVLHVEAAAVHVQHYRWDATHRHFVGSDRFSFARRSAADPAVSAAGGAE